MEYFFRDPASLVKPLKESATDEEKAAREVKLAENKPKVFCYLSNNTLESTLNQSHFQASRILVLVRHGQYNLDGTQDSERFFAFPIFINMFIETWSRANGIHRYLTELGQKQAAVTGQRLGELYARYLQVLETYSFCIKIIVNQNCLRFAEAGRKWKQILLWQNQTSQVHHDQGHWDCQYHLETGLLRFKRGKISLFATLQLPVEIDQSSCDLIREGAPCIPEPPLEVTPLWSLWPIDITSLVILYGTYNSLQAKTR